MIRIFPMPVANYRIDGKDLFTENQMHSYAIQCQEAVEEQKNKNRIDPCSIYLSKPNAQETPPQREWKGLTDEDREEIEKWIEFKEAGGNEPVPAQKLVIYVEAKLKEKNGG